MPKFLAEISPHRPEKWYRSVCLEPRLGVKIGLDAFEIGRFDGAGSGALAGNYGWNSEMFAQVWFLRKGPGRFGSVLGLKAIAVTEISG